METSDVHSDFSIQTAKEAISLLAQKQISSSGIFEVSLPVISDCLWSKIRHVCQGDVTVQKDLEEHVYNVLSSHLSNLLPKFENILSSSNSPTNTSNKEASADTHMLRAFLYLHTVLIPWLDIGTNIDEIRNIIYKKSEGTRQCRRRQRWMRSVAEFRQRQDKHFQQQVCLLEAAEGGFPKHRAALGRDESLSEWKPVPFKEKLLSLVSTNVILQMSGRSWHVIAEFYHLGLSVFIQRNKTMKDMPMLHNESGLSNTSHLSDCSDSDDRCGGCFSSKCFCVDVNENYHQVNLILSSLHLLQRVTYETVKEEVSQKVKEQVRYTCHTSLDISWVVFLTEWIKKLSRFLEQTFIPCRYGSASLSLLHSVAIVASIKENAVEDAGLIELVEEFKDSLLRSLYQEIVSTRIDQLFEIIIDYDDSEPALNDLRQCLPKTNLRLHLIKSLRNALENRLLHPGVNTSDILSAYMYAMRALRSLDNTGVVFEQTCEPIKRYLRQREDTVRCIMKNLLEQDSDIDLIGELKQTNTSLLLDEVPFLDDEFDKNWMHWYPDPADADPTRSSRSRRTSDVISTLVNIYGSKDKFVTEYRNLLAAHILDNKTFLTTNEVKNLELLKKKFGESQLISCEVMLKDLKDSAQLNKMIRERTSTCVNGMILSGVCWPTFTPVNVTLPRELQELLDNYQRAYKEHTGDRTIVWVPHAGKVTMQVELRGKRVEICADPIQAAIIWHFTDKECWRIDELSETLTTDISLVRKKISFWQSKGLIIETSKDYFTLCKDGIDIKKASLEDVMEEDDAESIMASLQQQKQEELELFFRYMSTVLKTAGTLSYERVTNLLKMFSEGNEYTTEEIKKFIMGKVKEGKLIYAGGVYRLPKSNSFSLD